MRKPLPLPYGLTAKDVVERIRARHDDHTGLEDFPAPEHLAGVIDFALRRRKKLRAVDAQGNVLDALLLVRLAQEELDRLHLWAVRAAKADGLKPKHVMPAAGLRSRQGIDDRIELLARKVTAARLHVSTEALDDTAPTTDTPEHELRALAKALLSCWEELTTNADIDEWAEGIELVLRAKPTSHTGESLRAQMKLAVEEIDDLSSRTGVSPARSTSAAQALNSVRML
ncbi:hypothetical protein [Actinomadura sp. NPDC048394]|uniref:hypothetical protein n=1 Tax=Actinomadura sp. NPDC048394 TaxID=3158223 RepID=UPI0034007C5C